jgi:hypothetical protein
VIAIIVVWIFIIAILIMSIFSLIDGIRNRSRFIISERITSYFISLIIATIFTILISVTSNEAEIGLLITVTITLTLIMGNLWYYTKIEKVRNVLEIKFRMIKYILLSIIILFINLIITSAVTN